MRRFLSQLLAVALILTSLASNAQKKQPDEDPEVRMGRENAAENDKSVKLIADAALLDRVNRIGQEIGAIANADRIDAHFGNADVKKFPYTFKIVDDKDVNAYSLPGGFIYVNKGLLDYVHSDDELAEVLAHEVSHAAHHHMMKLIKEQNKLQPLLPLIALAGVLAKVNSYDLNALTLGAQLYMVAKLNSYGIEAEKDADQTAVHYLLKTKYNPVGILTFMERLARDESRGPERTLGIFRTHPPSPERARALEAELTQLEVRINRRLTDPSLTTHVATVTVNGAKLAEVAMEKTVIARVTDTDSEKAEARAQKLSATIDKLLDDNLQMYEIRLSPDHSGVVARNKILVAFTTSDATAQQTTADRLAQSTVDAIRNILWQGQFNRIPANAGSPN